MDIRNFTNQLISESHKINSSERLRYIQSQLSRITDKDERECAEQLFFIAYALGADSTPTEEIVVLIHGIRTRAEWQDMVKIELEKNSNIKVYPIGYDFLDIISFLIPICLRKKPIEKILRELRGIQFDHKNQNISVIAHSFGTYVIAKILDEHTDILIKRIILCGSVVPVGFRWDKVRRLPNKIINDVGSKDIWPIFAKCASWGYGPSGTFGFKTHCIEDRYHNFKHSDFFSKDFINEYWKPFITSDTITKSPWTAERSTTPWFLSVIPVIPFKTIILTTLVVSISLYTLDLFPFK